MIRHGRLPVVRNTIPVSVVGHAGFNIHQVYTVVRSRPNGERASGVTIS